MCSYLGHTYMMWCWETQHVEYSRAWNASLEPLSHWSHCKRTNSSWFFYILKCFSSVSVSRIVFPCSQGFRVLYSLRHARAELCFSHTTLLFWSSYLYMSVPVSPHLSDRSSQRLLSKHAFYDLTHPHTPILIQLHTNNHPSAYSLTCGPRCMLKNSNQDQLKRLLLLLWHTSSNNLVKRVQQEV